MMMKNSPAHPQYEARHYDDNGFDLQQDFSMFLEEAKQHGKEAKLKSSSVHPEESTGPDKGKKGKKSWKRSLVSWWKAEKKSKPREEHTNNNNSQSKAYGKRHGYVSGPIYNNSTKGPPDGKQWLSTSGPLTGLFKPTKKKESEVPYMSLHQQNTSHASQNYGPLYVVT